MQILIIAMILFAWGLFAGLFSHAAAYAASEECYINFFIEPIDEDSALKHCEERFAAGDARSGYWLGVYYYDRNRIIQARNYYKKSAEMGDVFSLHMMGIGHLWGAYGNELDVQKGLEYIKKAADKGFGESQFMYAHVYDRVYYKVERDLDVAWDYYNRAAQNGNETAMIKLSGLYLYGDNWQGGIGNCQKAQWHQPNAPFEERGSYADLPIKCDEDTGLQYLKDAAKIGSIHAMTILKDYYRDQKPNKVLEAYWLLQISQWKHPLEDFEILIEKISPIFDNSYVESRKKAAAKKELNRIDAKTMDKAKSIKALETEKTFICSFPDFQWYYICTGG